MKTLRLICAGMILSLTFAVPVFAGDIYAPGYVSTEKPPTTTTTTIITTVIGVVY